MGPLRLTLVRHAHAVPANDQGADFTRPLSPRGRTEATGVGEWLARAGLVPDRLVTSSALRTRTTAELIAAGIGTDDVHGLDELYNAEAAAIWHAALAHAGHARHLLLVGHNPGISRLAGRLAAGASGSPRRLDLPPAGLVTATWHATAWKGLDPDAATGSQVVLP